MASDMSGFTVFIRERSPEGSMVHRLMETGPEEAL